MVKSGTQCSSVVACCRLNVNLIEVSGAHELAVCGAIQGDTSGQGQFPLACHRPEIAADVQHRLVQDLLKRRGDITVNIQDFVIGFSLRRKLL